MNIPFISDLGDFAVVPNFQGEWEFKNVYVAGSLVSYKGKLYEARTLVDQSQDAVVIGHDDFQRADTVDGWGTASDGTEWKLTDAFAGETTVGDFRISGNKGVMDAINPSDFGTIQFGAIPLTSNNLDILIRFYYTGDTNFGYRILAKSDEFENIILEFAINNGLSNGNDFLTTLYDDLGSSLDYYSRNNLPILPMEVDTDYLIRAQTSGFQYRIKLWKESDSEPIAWTYLLNNSYIEVVGRFFSLTYYIISVPTTLYTREVTIYSLPDAPDINTTDWLLIG